MDAAARRYLEDPSAMNCPWVESPFFEQLLEHANLPPEDAALARKFHEDGYVVIEPAADAALINAVEAEYTRFFDPKTEYPDAPKELRALLKRDPTRKQDAWYVS
jgi:hypothetical protein